MHSPMTSPIHQFTRSPITLPLSLLVLLVGANHPHHPAATDDLALVANALHRCSNLHVCLVLASGSGRWAVLASKTEAHQVNRGVHSCIRAFVHCCLPAFVPSGLTRVFLQSALSILSGFGLLDWSNHRPEAAEHPEPANRRLKNYANVFASAFMHSCITPVFQQSAPARDRPARARVAPDRRPAPG